MVNGEKEEEISFEEFKRNEPDEIVIKKAGLFGEDLVLKKTNINGVIVYISPPIKWPP